LELRKQTDDLTSSGSLSYKDRPGRKLPIVFLHGSGFSKEVFHNQFSGSQLEDHRLISLDLPGHGASPDAVDSQAVYSYRGFASVVGDFIGELNLDRCIVVGWSLGGHIAFELLDYHPQVAGVMAFGAPPAPAGTIGLLRSLNLSMNLLLLSKARFSRTEAERFERTCLGGMDSGAFVDTLLRTDQNMRPCLSKSVLGHVGTDQRERVISAKTPICLLHGAQDPIVRTGYMQSLRSPSIVGGRTIIFDDAGHAPFLEVPDKFDNLLKRFSTLVETGQDISNWTFEPDIARAV